MTEDIVIIQAIIFLGGVVVVILSNYFAMKYGLNGLKSAVDKIQVDVKTLLESDAEQDKLSALNEQGLQNLTARLDRNRRKEDHV